MVAPADVTRRIDRDLRTIRAEVNFLPRLAETWGDETEANRYVWYSEWRDAAARLGALDRDVAAGLMTDDQLDEYEALCAQLRSAAPILLRLGLVVPLPGGTT